MAKKPASEISTQENKVDETSTKILAIGISNITNIPER